VDGKDVASILRKLAEYLRRNPNQGYQVSVSMTGFNVEVGAPGATGFQVNLQVSGGSGNVTGAHIETKIGNAEVAFAEAAADAAIAELMRLVATTLEELAGEVEQSTPDVGKVRSLLERLAGYAMPGVIGESAALLLRYGLGLAV
jgi:hypothetical protein